MWVQGQTPCPGLEDSIFVLACSLYIMQQYAKRFSLELSAKSPIYANPSPGSYPHGQRPSFIPFAVSVATIPSGRAK